jgi:hypothetical protein
MAYSVVVTVGWLEGVGYCRQLDKFGSAAQGSVKEGLSGMWLQGCGPNLGEAAHMEFFILSQVLAVVQLAPD